MKLKGMIYTIISAILFGITPVLGSYTYTLGNTGFNLAFFRNLFGVPILAMVYIISSKGKGSFKTGRLKDLIILSILGTGLTTVMLYGSYTYLGVGTATAIHFVYPLFVFLVCVIFFKDKINKVQLLCLLLATVGVMFFLDTKSSGNLYGIFLAAGSGITYALYMVFMEKKNLASLNPLLNSFYLALIAAVLLFSFGSLKGKILWNLKPEVYLYIAIISFLTSFLAVVLLQKGIEHIGSSLAAIFSLLEPITSIVFSIIFLGEVFTLKKAVACALIFSAVMILVLLGLKKAEVQ